MTWGTIPPAILSALPQSLRLVVPSHSQPCKWRGSIAGDGGAPCWGSETFEVSHGEDIENGKLFLLVGYNHPPAFYHQEKRVIHESSQGGKGFVKVIFTLATTDTVGKLSL